MTSPEVFLWHELRGRKAGGLKFRRHHPFGRYILDFYCAEVWLAVEIDGWGHNMGDRAAKDAFRDHWLRAQGVKVLRFSATDVLKEMDGVIETIVARARPSAPFVTPFGATLPPVGEEWGA